MSFLGFKFFNCVFNDLVVLRIFLLLKFKFCNFNFKDLVFVVEFNCIVMFVMFVYIYNLKLKLLIVEFCSFR